MRGWSLPVGLAVLCLAPAVIPAHANNVVAVEFLGYQQLNGKMLFQIHLDNVAPADQPPLLMTGTRLKFGPYQIGAFHMIHQRGVDAATGQPIDVDVSTLELINVDTGAKIQLPFRRKVQLAPGPAALQTRDAVQPQRLRTA